MNSILNSFISLCLLVLVFFAGSRAYNYGGQLIHGPWADTFSNLGSALSWTLGTLFFVFWMICVAESK